ncbi:expressed unknown protein [Seminavis robusta]|uniref:Uncharacterized protein n=1 Tax=Seminavis robusta TaxID=568900 RepID=A0A9N8I0K0_9STRA|nr:expressed unknown protein [Seminavis robusta]|eukprot:Sro2735_g335900.1 n/a (550) ;mRNA; f:7441-9234
MSSGQVDIVKQCIGDTVNIQENAADFSVFRPVLRHQERTNGHHHNGNSGTQYLYMTPESDRQSGTDEECRKQGGMAVTFSTTTAVHDDDPVLRCHRTGGHSNHASVLVSLNSVFDCFAASEACEEVSMDPNMAAAVFLGVSYEWQCSVVPASPEMDLPLLEPPSPAEADFDAKLYQEIELCRSQTENFRISAAAILEQASLEYTAHLETIKPEVHEEPQITTVQFPDPSVQTYTPVCEQAGGQMVGVDSVILECTQIRSGKVSITHYRNYFLCQPQSSTSSCTPELMPCDLRHKGELFQSSCTIRSGDDSHQCTYTGSSADEEEVKEEEPTHTTSSEAEPAEPTEAVSESETEEPPETTEQESEEAPPQDESEKTQGSEEPSEEVEQPSEESEEPAEESGAASEAAEPTDSNPEPTESSSNIEAEEQSEQESEPEEETPPDVDSPESAAAEAVPSPSKTESTSVPELQSETETQEHHQVEAFMGAIVVLVLVALLALYCCIRRCKRKRLAKNMSRRAYELTALDLGSSDHRDDDDNPYTDTRGGLPSLT